MSYAIMIMVCCVVSISVKHIHQDLVTEEVTRKYHNTKTAESAANIEENIDMGSD